MNYKLSALMSQYTDKNINNQFEPVAVGRYGIRKRSDIYKKDLASDYSKNKVIYKDTLTIGLGSKQIDVGVLTEDAIYSVSPAYTTFKINTSVVKSQYLELFFKAFNDVLTQKYMIASARQGKKVDIKSMLNEEIFIPDFDVQEQVISNINLLVRAMEKDERIVSLYDELTKARFVEMFGDPVRNEKEWQTKALEDACKSIVDCPHSTPSYTSKDTGFMCIRTSIVKKNRIMWKDIEYIPEEEYKQRIQKKKPEKGDVVYTREGAILGIAAVIDRDCNVALGQRSMLLSPDSAFCTPEFISVAMNFDSFLDNALKGVSGSASPHINVGDIKAFKMILPPIAQQEAFSAFVAQVDKSKAVVRKRINLYNELMHKKMDEYFYREVS